jgi:hypothetical protein
MYTPRKILRRIESPMDSAGRASYRRSRQD